MRIAQKALRHEIHPSHAMRRAKHPSLVDAYPSAERDLFLLSSSSACVMRERRQTLSPEQETSAYEETTCSPTTRAGASTNESAVTKRSWRRSLMSGRNVEESAIHACSGVKCRNN